MRTESFRPVLLAHEHAQHGEGLCIPAILGAQLRSMGRREWATEWIAKELGTTIADGTPEPEILPFLSSCGVLTYDEANCSLARIISLLTCLPPDIGFMISMWDDRPPRPGYTMLTDPPEEHNLALLYPRGLNGRIYFEAYDPDTIIGGPKRIPAATLIEIWHDGPGSVWGQPPEGGTHIHQDGVGWVLVMGADRSTVHKLAGPADYEVNPYRFDKQTEVLRSGKFRVEPERVELS